VKLLNDLFKITGNTVTGSGFTAAIELSPGHIVYEGHFPGHPVTPGVVLLQILHEIIEHHFGKKIRVITLDDCKFLKIVDPEERRQIQINVEIILNNAVLHVKATGKSEAETLFKIRGVYEFK
jgi:3-hydroxyacyl-[acyl-carrier-protein] dehydratase